MAHLHETLLGRLGSRLTLHFQPARGQVLYSALGKYFDKPLPIRAALLHDGHALPLFPIARNGFDQAEQSLSPTSLTVNYRSWQLGLAARLRIAAPFYPQDVMVSCAPAYLLEVSWQPWSRRGPAATATPSRVVVEYTGDPLTLDEEHTPIRWADTFTLNNPHWLARAGPEDSLNRQTFRADMCAQVLAPRPAEAQPDRIVLTLQPEQTATLVLASYCADEVLEVLGVRHRFKYTALWPDLSAIVEWVAANLEHIGRRCAFFDSLFAQSTLDKAAHDLIAFSLQSYIQNTWWTVAPDGRDWFSCWEGNCTYHSTIDVEYNLAWFYLLLWPELLEMTMDEWARYEKFGAPGQEPIAVAYEASEEDGAPADTSWLSHDMGALLIASGQDYPHEMELEENCNFILLLHALAHFTGSEAPLHKHWAMVQRLCRYIMAADTTGDGVPDVGVANTIDDASPAVQYSREQVYLAFKCMCALRAAAAMARRLRQADFAEQCDSFAAGIDERLQAEAWLGDHFAVCIDRSAEGLTDVWTGEPLEGELEGWDAYHIYAANGLLYLLATDFQPPTDYARLRQDIQAATLAALCEYGDFHSSADRSNLWVSQNLHRDFVAALLAVDNLDMVQRYWAFELMENTTGRGGGFVDTYGWNHLHLYPRGITSLGLVHALGGIRLSRLDRRLVIAPCRRPCRIPLLALADWPAQRVPWIEVGTTPGRAAVTITEKDLLAGLQVDVRLPEQTPPRADTGA